MRTSQYFLSTSKEFPSDADLISHKLMHRAGLIFKNGSGLYSWLPLGLRVLRKVEAIVREEMDKIGAQECTMITIQPAELWQESGRWEHYGRELLRMRDRHDRDFCFGPTHEEVITDIARNLIHSYKQLPVTFYQIQTKFRDEIRPRFGIMRAREFLMKDAYSFNADAASLNTSYEAMYRAYCNIFSRLKLNFRAVAADTGQIGGSASHEFQVLASSGEDLIAISTESDYAANIEMATALAPKPSDAPQQPLEKVPTPNRQSITAVAEFLGLPQSQCVKTIVVQGNEYSSSNLDLVVIALRGDHQLNEIKAEKHPRIKVPLTMATDADLRQANLLKGYIGLKDLTLPYLVDHDAAVLSNFSMGAMEESHHYINVNWKRDVALPQSCIGDFRSVVAGDASPDGKGKIELIRGIEVGHIFKLGDKYSQAMNMKVAAPEGEMIPMMGCYGIGVSRIVAAAIEQSHDAKGIVWSDTMAPFQIAIAALGYTQNTGVNDQANNLYLQWQALGYEVLLDDRDMRIGQMLGDLELIGIPHIFVISERNLQAQQVEYKNRKTGQSTLIAIDNIKQWLWENIPTVKTAKNSL